ncbi:hypothetical protein C8R46DRAFT_1078899, partial [Mycena filopes]
MSTRTKGRACDACSRRKIRCDGPNPPSGCSNCQAFSSPCTYIRHSVKRGPVYGTQSAAPPPDYSCFMFSHKV